MVLRQPTRGSFESRGGSSSSKRYSYAPRTTEEIKKRASQEGSAKDFFLPREYNLFTPDVGDNWIRILPPTWESPEHYGYDIFVHYQVGVDDSAYLCRQLMDKGPCPICEERAKADRDGQVEYANEIKPSKRVLVWIINRRKENDGPLLWTMPWTIDRDICKLSIDGRTGDIYPVDDPESGYDIEFERKGTGKNTKYIGMRIARKVSSVKPEWVDFVAEHPIPDLLQFYEYDQIADTFSGVSQEIEGDVKEEIHTDEDLDPRASQPQSTSSSRVTRASLRR